MKVREPYSQGLRAKPRSILISLYFPIN